MDFLITLAEGFIGMFQAGADVFMGYMTGIIPLLVTLLTAMKAVVALIGEERVERFMERISKFAILRHTLFPVSAVFFFTNPMCYTVGRFLPEEQKTGFYDAAVSFVHPVTGLFPHANSAELFVWLGIAGGFNQVGNQSQLAIAYFVTGIIVIAVRGFVTDQFYKFFSSRGKKQKEAQNMQVA